MLKNNISSIIIVVNLSNNEEKGEKMKNKENDLYIIKVYDKKLNWKKVIFVIFILLVIIVSTYLGIRYAKKDNNIEKLTQENDTQLENESQINNEQLEEAKPEETPLEEIPVIEAKNKIPMYTETSRENVSKIYSSTPDAKRVFLTFDDGPSSNVTPLILDLLKENDIKATFFTLGSRVIQNPDIVKRAYEEGHYIANHGYSHVYSSIYASEENLLNEYNQTEEAIRNAIGVPEYSSHLFRFPGGSVGGIYDSVKKQYLSTLRENNILYLDWNCLSEDSTGNRTKEQLVQYVKNTSQNKNSVVVLMHDAGDKILTYETLQEVIDYFRENGYTFYNLYDLIEYEIK